MFLSSYAGDDFVLAGVARGASGFVSKSAMYPDLAEAVSHVAEGRSFVPSARVLPQWRRAAGHRHDLLPYATDEDLVIAVTGFVDSALEAGDSVIAVVSAPHRNALDAEFERRGLNITALAGSGRYTAVDSTIALESILVGGIPDADLFAAAMDLLVDRALSAATSSSPHVTVFGGSRRCSACAATWMACFASSESRACTQPRARCRFCAATRPDAATTRPCTPGSARSTRPSFQPPRRDNPPTE